MDNTEDYVAREIERCNTSERKNCTVALQWMSPDTYLRLLPAQVPAMRADRAPEEWWDAGSIKDLTEKMVKGKDIDPLWIDLTSRRVLKMELTDEYLNRYEHEGRHRAVVARKLGIELVPVIVIQDRALAEKCLIPNYK